MSMQVTSSPINTIAPQPSSDAASRIANRREAYGQMCEAMKSGNLDSARSAYATMVRNAPPGATMQPGSPIAQLGKALITGDMSAAQTAWNTMVQDHSSSATPPVDTSPVAPVVSSTGGVAGSTLSVTA